MLDYGNQKLGRIGQFRFWCQKVLPAVYDDSLSYYELLAKVIEKLNEVIEMTNGYNSEFAILLEQLQDIQDEFDKFKDGGYEDLLDKWFDGNSDKIADIIRQSMKMVWFGLNRQGYFVAYIPDSWSDITFDTGFDDTLDTYGRLILRYNVNNENETVDQTPEGRN